MEQLRYLILNGINAGNRYVTWYQLDRMFRSQGLHKNLDKLIMLLDQLESEGLIIQRNNNDKPKILSLTEKGQIELMRLSEIYGNDVESMKDN